MADIKITELAEATSLSDSDVLAGVNASTTRKFSLARLKSFFFSALTKADVGLGNVANVLQYSADNKPTPSEIGAVPETRTINGKALAQDVNLDASDVGVSISTSTPNMDGVGAAGSTGDVSDAGHVHPTDTTRVPNYGKGENLLRNWYFVGGGTGRGIFPVNQRGLSSYSTVDPSTVDGWALQAGLISPISAGLQLSSDTRIAQAISSGRALLQNKTITFSVLIASISGNCRVRIASSTGSTYNTTAIIASEYVSASGILSLTYTLGEITSNRNFNFIIESDSGSTVVIAATKLELGSEQTVAHQENGTWVLNEIPDYEEELLKCQTSTADSSDTYANKSLATEQQLAYIETGTTASRAYAVGEYFCWNGLLYRVTSAISSGASFTVGTNCEQATVGAELTAIDSKMYLVQYTGNATYTYTMPAGRWFLIYANRANNSGTGLYAAHITGANGYLTTIFETSGFSNLMVLTLSGRTLSIQVKSTYATLNILNFGGV